MLYDVTLQIDPETIVKDETIGLVRMRLSSLRLDADLAEWNPDADGSPAIARFVFRKASSREDFVVEALTIPGVSTSPLLPRP